ncbi:MAG: hypothetical protein HY976_01020 [Candidatus Kerfeldbacteria bacterium]|nr:hypothetical protein [Candidatus Kerfeldbacteria bacterium]
MSEVEGQHPTAEDISQAEQAMTTSQADASKRREERLNEMTPGDRLEQSGGYKNGRMVGDINGHHIEISTWLEGVNLVALGKLDGKRLAPRDAEAIFSHFYGLGDLRVVESTPDAGKPNVDEQGLSSAETASQEEVEAVLRSRSK